MKTQQWQQQGRLKEDKKYFGKVKKTYAKVNTERAYCALQELALKFSVAGQCRHANICASNEDSGKTKVKGEVCKVDKDNHKGQ